MLLAGTLMAPAIFAARGPHFYSPRLASSALSATSFSRAKAAPEFLGTIMNETREVRTVTSTEDAGPGSLRQAIADAAPGDVIDFALPLPAVIRLHRQLVIDADLTVQGPGPASLILRRNDTPSTPAFRVLHVKSGIVRLSGLTIQNGRALAPNGGDNMGGGILNQGFLTLSNCVVTQNEAPFANYGLGYGGGIFTTGPLVLQNSTISDNEAAIAGGGLFVHVGGTLRASGCTISGNSAGMNNSEPYGPGQGGGLNVQGAGDCLLQNCTVSGNQARGFGGGGGILNISWEGQSSSLALESCTITENRGALCGGIANVIQPGALAVATLLKNTLVASNSERNFGLVGNALLESLGNNLDSDGTSGFVHGTRNDLVGDRIHPLDARLGPLDRHGGLTRTHALLEGSPALDAGEAVDANGHQLPTDQRGAPRPQGPASDIGAYENMAPVIVCPEPLAMEAVSEAASPVTITAEVFDADGDPLTVLWVVDGAAWATNSLPAAWTPVPRAVALSADLEPGPHSVEVLVLDGKTEPTVCTTSVTVIESAPPQITAITADPPVLWPPNHKMLPVRVSVQTEGGRGSVTSRIVEVRCNDVDPFSNRRMFSWYVMSDLGVLLRAERAGNGEDRVYILTVEARDEAGKTSMGTVKVVVPHDHGQVAR